MRRTLLGGAVCTLVFLYGCKPAAPPVKYAPIGTIREVMKSVVEPSADFIWGSVSTNVTSKGVEKKIPRTDEEWDEVHKRAIALVEATNLLLIPNRHVAKPNEKADNPDSERDPKDIDVMLAKDRATFLKHIGALREVSLKMLTSVEARDVQGMDTNGQALDKVCEDCHMIYWYLPDK